MTITDMTEHEKSVMLARLCGWRIISQQQASGVYHQKIVDSNGNDLGMKLLGASVHPRHVELNERKFNLYDPANMALAWRVLNWAISIEFGAGAELHQGIKDMVNWLMPAWATKSPPVAQASWLDEILKLAIETRLIPDA